MCLRVLGLSLIFWDFAFLVFSVRVLTCAAHISWAKSNHVANDTSRRRKRIPLGIGGSFPLFPGTHDRFDARTLPVAGGPAGFAQTPASTRGRPLVCMREC